MQAGDYYIYNQKDNLLRLASGLSSSEMDDFKKDGKIPLAHGYDSNTKILLEEQEIVIFIEAKGEISIEDIDGVIIDTITVPKQEGGREHYEEVFLEVSDGEIRFKFPIYKWIDNYPHCDGESDRWDKVIIDYHEIKYEIKKENVMEERMEDLGQELEKSYAYMGNGEYDTDTLLAWEKINKYMETKEILPVTVSGIVNKGVIALVEGVRGFIPVSRLDIEHVEEINDWLGRDIRVRVIDADMEKGKLVLSAREILREESAAAKKAQREVAIAAIKVGSVVEGTVESLQTYGAFVDLGDGVTGLVHISQISENRIKSPKEALEVGQKVTAKVIKNEGGKISLSIRDLLEEQRLKEEEEIRSNVPEVESIGTSLGSLLSGFKFD